MTSWLHWSPAIWLVVDALAVYRLTRLAVKDTITQPARRWLFGLDRAGDGCPFAGPAAPFANTLYALTTAIVSCPWCMSVWVSAGVVVLTYFTPLVWSFPAAGLAF
ncbi:MAG TPA: DUF1360 domain-containing protein, partial [Jatrophihabitantaceae bacterium]